ncbi:MAG: uracil-DNA glycosylase, partial [Myxococcota bacterium]|nr:uracil-DNA glycosylase [Myxococcota bacterium]
MTDAVRQAVAELASDLRAWLEYAEETGADFLPWEPPTPRQAAPAPPPQARPPQSRPQTQPPAPAPTQSRRPRPSAPSQGGALDAIRAELGDCRRCGLHEGRRNIVFGVGNPSADVVIVGEAPGRDEDMTGEPFVGRSGQLLTRMLEAIGVAREDAYICNVLKCRPPRNRDPQADEIATCSPFMTRQIQAIAPKVIITSGRFASQTVLGLELSMGRLRGTIRSFHGVPVVPMYHPAYLLRNPSAKRQTYEDLLTVKSILLEGDG